MKSKQIAVLGIIAILIVAGVLVLTALPDKKQAAQTKPATQKAVNLSDPALIVKDFKKYNGQEVAVKGKVVKTENKDFYLVGQEAKPSAIKLDFSKTNIDPKTLVDLPTSEKEHFVAKPLVTVTGKINTPQKGPASIIVSSVK